MFEIENGTIRISVRNLVEFIYRSGDIDNRVAGVSEIDAMQAGSRIHRKIQKSMGPTYRSEVPLKMAFERNILEHGVEQDSVHKLEQELKLDSELESERYILQIEGRADGIFEKDDHIIIDEIKGMYANVLAFEEPIVVHKAQVLCYAYIYLVQQELEEICIQLTYADLDTEVIKRFEETWTKDELEKWFNDTLQRMFAWTDYWVQSGILRNESIKKVDFPFSYRPGQKELAVSVYRTIQQEKVLFIQAPTGVGKTISTVFPSVKAVGEGLAEKIFYLTSKTIARTVAEEAFEILRKQDLEFRTITLTAKEKICPREQMQCNPDACPYAKGHFDRVNEAVFDIIHSERAITREVVLSYAEKHQVCPFEYALDISYWCDGIICDYNYVFDPNAYLRRFFGEGNHGRYIFLIDEAHNLVERGREMYSAYMSKEAVLDFKNLVKNRSKKLTNAAEKLNKALLEIKRQITDEYLILESVGSVVVHMMVLYDEILKYNEEHPFYEEKEEVMNFFFRIRDFITISELCDEHYVIYAMIRSNGDLFLKMFCVDPSKNLNLCLNRGISAVFFSATLLPIRYYRNLLRGDEEDYAIYAKSPFDTKNRKVLIANDVTTKYSSRGAKQYDSVYNYIVKIARAHAGNYMVFFPSYSYMQEIYERTGDEFDVICQNVDMTEEQKEEFLLQFAKPHNDKSFVGYCVMGGIFSEGIDLKEESLIGAIVVGNGLPQIGVERRILMNWFDQEGKGFAYAYQYPGLNKVLQSAGRVIRTEKDRGIIVLLDHRFLNGEYDGLMPEEWSNMEIVSQDNVEQILLDFWKENK